MLTYWTQDAVPQENCLTEGLFFVGCWPEATFNFWLHRPLYGILIHQNKQERKARECQKERVKQRNRETEREKDKSHNLLQLHLESDIPSLLSYSIL